MLPSNVKEQWGTLWTLRGVPLVSISLGIQLSTSLNERTPSFSARGSWSQSRESSYSFTPALVGLLVPRSRSVILGQPTMAPQTCLGLGHAAAVWMVEKDIEGYTRFVGPTVTDRW